jgi:hypothetical protein
VSAVQYARHNNATAQNMPDNLIKLRQLVATFMWRHSKAQVQHQFHLPPLNEEMLKFKLSEVFFFFVWYRVI